MKADIQAIHEKMVRLGRKHQHAQAQASHKCLLADQQLTNAACTACSDLSCHVQR